MSEYIETFAENLLRQGGSYTTGDQASFRNRAGTTQGQTKNLFQRATANDGYFMSNTGVVTQSSVYGYSDYIAVEPGQAYTGWDGINRMQFTTFFDANKALVAGGSSSAVTTFTVPAGVFFVRVTYFLPTGKLFQFEKASSATFRVSGDAETIKQGLRVNGDSASFLRRSKNIFNWRDTVDGKFVIAASGLLQTNVNLCYSGYIPVLQGVRYVSTGVMDVVAFFDEAKVIQAVPASGTSTSFTIPVGSAIRFVIVSTAIAIKKTLQVEASGPSQFATGYAPYGHYLGDSPFGPLIPSSSTWAEKVWSQLGDSITQNNNWQPYVVTALGMLSYNFGVSGTKMTDTTGSDTTAICRNERIDLLQTGSDMVSIMGGTNDWAQDVALGAITDTGTNTYYGALKTCVTRVITKFPTARVILMTPLYGRSSFTDPEVNTLGLRVQDYGTAVLAVGRLLGVPAIDTCANLGINSINYTTYYNDGLHPNPGLGGGRLGDLYIRNVMNYSRN